MGALIFFFDFGVPSEQLVSSLDGIAGVIPYLDGGVGVRAYMEGISGLSEYNDGSTGNRG